MGGWKRTKFWGKHIASILFGLCFGIFLLINLPIVVHKPRCENPSYKFSTRLTPEYINLIGEFVSESWGLESQKLDLGTSGYYFVYRDRIFLTHSDNWGDGLHNLMKKGVGYLLIPRTVAGTGYDERMLSLDLSRDVELFHKWRSAYKATFGSERGEAEDQAFQKIYCEVMMRVSQGTRN